MKAKKTRRELLVLGLALTAAALSIWLPSGGFRLIAATISPSDEELLAENEALRQELALRRQELTDYLDCQEENKRLRGLFQLGQQQPDYTLLPAELIRYEPMEDYGGFVLNVGEDQGVTVNSPVVTAEGLVGAVTKVSGSACQVTTILSPNLKIAASDKQSSDNGILTGRTALSDNGETALTALSEKNHVAKGDLVVTSGGVFPENIVIGTVNQDRGACFTAAFDRRLADRDRSSSAALVRVGAGDVAGTYSRDGRRKYLRHDDGYADAGAQRLFCRDGDGRLLLHLKAV